jgi:hypothetical protein
MITKGQAIALGDGTLHTPIYSMLQRYADGKRPYEVRPNGRCHTWKTSPDKFSLPITIKIGFRGHSYITQRNAEEFTLDFEEALKATELKGPL